jgi:hypothetical protein
MEGAHEAGAPQFAIREYVQAEFLLASEDSEDALIFEFPELRRVHTLVVARLQQFRWTQEAPDMIGSICRWHKA